MSEQPLIWEQPPGALRTPVVICAFKGWNDAGEAASTAVNFLIDHFQARRFAQIDSEKFFDFQANRPVIKLREGVPQEIVWPTTEIFSVRLPNADSDLVLIRGSEPSLRWSEYVECLYELVEVLDAGMLISLGSLLAEVPHTQPSPLTGAGSDPEIVAKMGIHPPTFEGPTGIVGVLHAVCSQRGIPAASIWAAVPQYIAATENPKAALALVRKIEVVAGITINATDLESSAEQFEKHIAKAIEANSELRDFIGRLENSPNISEPIDLDSRSSGDSIAQEFQRFLQQQETDEPDSEEL